MYLVNFPEKNSILLKDLTQDLVKDQFFIFFECHPPQELLPFMKGYLFVHEKKSYHPQSILYNDFKKIPIDQWHYLFSLKKIISIKEKALNIYYRIYPRRKVYYKGLHLEGTYFLGDSSVIGFFDSYQEDQKTHLLSISTSQLEAMNTFQLNYSETFFKERSLSEILNFLKDLNYTYLIFHHKTFQVQYYQQGDHLLFGLHPQEKNEFILSPERKICLISTNIQSLTQSSVQELESLVFKKDFIQYLKFYSKKFKELPDLNIIYLYVDPKSLFQVVK